MRLIFWKPKTLSFSVYTAGRSVSCKEAYRVIPETPGKNVDERRKHFFPGNIWLMAIDFLSYKNLFSFITTFKCWFPNLWRTLYFSDLSISGAQKPNCSIAKGEIIQISHSFHLKIGWLEDGEFSGVWLLSILRQHHSRKLLNQTEVNAKSVENY